MLPEWRALYDKFRVEHPEFEGVKSYQAWTQTADGKAYLRHSHSSSETKEKIRRANFVYRMENPEKAHIEAVAGGRKSLGRRREIPLQEREKRSASAKLAATKLSSEARERRRLAGMRVGRARLGCKRPKYAIENQKKALRRFYDEHPERRLDQRKRVVERFEKDPALRKIYSERAKEQRQREMVAGVDSLSSLRSKGGMSYDRWIQPSFRALARALRRLGFGDSYYGSHERCVAGYYIDFFNGQARLAIEADSFLQTEKYDKQHVLRSEQILRQQIIEQSLGFSILRWVKETTRLDEEIITILSRIHKKSA
jgi:very-short-patch-repair endonuclease